MGKRSLLVHRSCYDRWRWLKHPRSGSSGSLECGRRHSFRKPTRSGNGTQFHKSFVQLPERNFGVTGRTSSRCQPDPKNKQVQQLQAKPSSSYPAFERGVRGGRFYQGTPTQGVPRLIIEDRSSSISSDQNPIGYRIGNFVQSSIPEAARTIIAYPIRT